jgi:hypothetical protein
VGLVPTDFLKWQRNYRFTCASCSATSSTFEVTQPKENIDIICAAIRCLTGLSRSEQVAFTRQEIKEFISKRPLLRGPSAHADSVRQKQKKIHNADFSKNTVEKKGEQAALVCIKADGFHMFQLFKPTGTAAAQVTPTAVPAGPGHSAVARVKPSIAPLVLDTTALRPIATTDTTIRSSQPASPTSTTLTSPSTPPTGPPTVEWWEINDSCSGGTEDELDMLLRHASSVDLQEVQDDLQDVQDVQEDAALDFPTESEW